MLDIYNSLVLELSTNRPVVLATIIRQDGSSPRSAGTKFLIRRDGSLAGSIGGGSIEAKVISKAFEIMGKDESYVLEIRLSSKELAGTDMVCGGAVDVLVQSILPGDEKNLELYNSAKDLIETGGRGVMATGPLLPAGKGGPVRSLFIKAKTDNSPHVIIKPSDILEEVVASALMHEEEVLASNLIQVVKADIGSSILIEPLCSRPTVIIFGGGHVALHLAPLLSRVGFNAVIVDDREEFANRSRFPKAARIIVSDFENCFRELYFTRETYSVIVTRGHAYDKLVLKNVLAASSLRNSRYIGMIGSQRKRGMIYDALIEDGVDPETLARVHAPIGIDIGAETPEEIAVSITAELIKVRAEGDRKLNRSQIDAFDE